MPNVQKIIVEAGKSEYLIPEPVQRVALVTIAMTLDGIEIERVLTVGTYTELTERETPLPVPACYFRGGCIGLVPPPHRSGEIIRIYERNPYAV